MTMDVRGMAPLLQVYDMPTALHFYCKVLEFEVIGSAPAPGGSFDWVLLKRNEMQLMLNTQYESHERPPEQDPARKEHHNDVSLFFSSPDIDAIYEHLKAQGLKLETPVNREYGMRQLYLYDPDGYEICFQWPVP